MNKHWIVLGASLLALFSSWESLQAGGREAATVDAATEVLQAFVGLQLKMIPPALLQDAQGVAIIPNVLKAGFVFGGRFGRGVVLTREPDGTWSNPVFITLAGGGVGWQIGVQSTDLVLVFKTRNGLNRILEGKGKLTLGADVAVAAGPIGRQAGAATDALLRAEIYSYSRSRGLFAGLSVEGAGVLVDFEAIEAYYQLPGGHPADLLARQGVAAPPAAEQLKGLLARYCTPGAILLGPDMR
jgi:SH3 domain-containing YSC84-like protein 1